MAKACIGKHVFRHLLHRGWKSRGRHSRSAPGHRRLRTPAICAPNGAKAAWRFMPGGLPIAAVVYGAHSCVCGGTLWCCSTESFDLRRIPNLRTKSADRLTSSGNSCSGDEKSSSPAARTGLSPMSR
jgi:hypothetical protein